MIAINLNLSKDQHENTHASEFRSLFNNFCTLALLVEQTREGFPQHFGEMRVISSFSRRFVLISWLISGCKSETCSDFRLDL